MSTPIEIGEEEWQDLKEEMSYSTPTTPCALVSEWVQELQKFYRDHLFGYPMKNHEENRVFSPRHDVCCVHVPDDGYVPFSKAKDDVEIVNSAAFMKMSVKRYLVTRVRFIFQSAYSLNEFAKTLPGRFHTTTINLELQAFHSDVFPAGPEGHRDLQEEQEKARQHLAEWMKAMKALPPRLYLEVRLIIPSFHRGHFDLNRETEEFRSGRLGRLDKLKVLWIGANGENRFLRFYDDYGQKGGNISLNGKLSLSEERG
ncbi:hypothetical protein FVEN_g6164 [Fusarium venenatum]|uniref:Uncharacterized protein n=2 Tax=Fusarium venenatum TaxID=56646 RepID=A0A2L2TJ24_9HYPO|nr:uncharacterized protein FVRRES_01933 [Fusarium venenatum]KAG8355864.1 hypothetical protein FVEN_g6164 [Fusarium venenatum]CEI65421.1 unnamed protein product [Fusarium venenatum]